MEYTYYLLNRPPEPGASPGTPDFTQTLTRENDDRSLCGYGSVSYRKPLSRRDIDAYELRPSPMVRVLFTSSQFDWLTNDFNGGRLHAYAIPDNIGRIGGALRALGEYFPDDGDVVSVPLVDDNGKYPFSLNCLSTVIESMPEWSRWMVQFVLQGCPVDRFDNMTPDEVIDESVRINDSGEYRLLID